MAICPLCRTIVTQRYMPGKFGKEGQKQVRCECGRTRSFRGEICIQESLFEEKRTLVLAYDKTESGEKK